MSFFNDVKADFKMNNWGVKLIYINVIAFLITIPFFYQFKFGFFEFPKFISLSGKITEALLFFWTLITYSFLHASVTHILFNMLTLYFAGRLFYTFFNDKQFLIAYFGGALVGGLGFLIVGLFIPFGYLVGASAAVLSVLFAVVFYRPMMDVRVIFFNVKLWHIGLFYFLVSLLAVGFDNVGGNVSHLAAIGFAYLNYYLLTKGVDISSWFKKKPTDKKTNFKKVYRNEEKVENSTNNTIDVNQKKIDDILDKISKSGYESLSKEEKEFLFKLKK